MAKGVKKNLPQNSSKSGKLSLFKRVKNLYHALPLWGKKMVRFAGWLVLIPHILVLLYSFFPVLITPLMVMRTFDQITSSDKKLCFKKDWEEINAISTNLQLAVVSSEDQLFTDHYGFDIKAIKNAIEHNKNHKRKLGASTISQQTAKNLFLWSGRSWIRKALEVYFTALIELIWSKERIMTVYLNIIEFGSGIYGAEAASLHYFKKSASKLTKNEAALLASVLPNPHKYLVAAPSSYVKNRQQRILRQMRLYGKLSY